MDENHVIRSYEIHYQSGQVARFPTCNMEAMRVDPSVVEVLVLTYELTDVQAVPCAVERRKDKDRRHV